MVPLWRSWEFTRARKRCAAPLQSGGDARVDESFVQVCHRIARSQTGVSNQAHLGSLQQLGGNGRHGLWVHAHCADLGGLQFSGGAAQGGGRSMLLVLQFTAQHRLGNTERGLDHRMIGIGDRTQGALVQGVCRCTECGTGGIQFSAQGGFLFLELCLHALTLLVCLMGGGAHPGGESIRVALGGSPCALSRGLWFR